MVSTAVLVDRDALQGHVEELAKSPRHSLYDADGHSRAIEYIVDAFQKGGLEVASHEFSGAGRTGINLVGRKAGTDPSLPPLWVTAHYDTVRGSPGADDNATGVATLLETARILGGATLRRTVELVAFDMEEVQPDGTSLVGSTAFASSLQKNQGHLGVYNLEMLGYTSGPNTQTYPPGFGVVFPSVFSEVQARDFRGDFLAVVSRGPSVEMGRRLKQAALQGAPGLNLSLIEVPNLLPMLPDAFRSDHASFWSVGVPAIMLSDTANFRNPHYHQPSDTPSTVDYDFLASAAQAVVAVVIRDAEATVAG